MNKIKIKANAKINLVLDVVGKRKDGYHDIETIFSEISLFDNLILKKTKKGIKINIAQEVNIPQEKNLCYKAAQLFFKETRIKQGVEIFLEKNIPVGAGLGGGSSDAAATLKGLNSLFNNPLSNDNLKKIALKIGMDVPFFIDGGCAVASGRGEKLKNIKLKKTFWLVIIKPNFSISTKEAYELIDKNLILTKNSSYAKIMTKALGSGLLEITESLYNIFERVVSIQYPGFPSKLKEKFKDAGADGVLMSGSGSAVYGIFRVRRSAYQAFEKLKRIPKVKVYLAKTLL